LSGLDAGPLFLTIRMFKDIRYRLTTVIIIFYKLLMNNNSIFHNYVENRFNLQQLCIRIIYKICMCNIICVWI
jgi:hypothetical protein